MNYAVVILFFVFIISLSYWFIAGHKFYIGPRTQAHVVNGMVIKGKTDSDLNDQEKAVRTS